MGDFIGNDDKERLSKERALELWDSGDIDKMEVGTFQGLRDIHRYLFHGFEDYKAGEIRKHDSAKGNFLFCKAIFIESNLDVVDKMPETTFDEIIEKYSAMNVVHPFYEGNGRSMRIWLDQMLKKNLRLCVDWAKVGKREYLEAMERSPVNSLEINVLLKSALTDKINDRQIYMRGIQQSYEYEDIYNHNIEDLDKNQE